MAGHLSQSEIDALLKKNTEARHSNPGTPDEGEENKTETNTAPQKQSKPLVEKVEFSPLNQRGKVYGAKPRFQYFDDIELVISGELGTADLTVRDLLKLKEGSVIKLNKMAGDSSKVLANEQFFGFAEVVVINDRFGLRVTHIGQEERKGAFRDNPENQAGKNVVGDDANKPDGTREGE